MLRSSPRAFRSGYQLRLSTRATELPARVRCAATIYRVQELFGHNVAMRCDGSKGLLFFSGILVTVGVTSDASRATTLGNGRISLVFGDRGLTALTDVRIGRTFRVKDDGFRVSVDGRAIESTALKDPHRQAERERVTYRWTSSGYEIDVVYEVKPEWLFVSKQIFIAKAPSQSYRVNEIEAFRMQLTEEVSDSFIPKSARPNLGTADSGVCLRFSDKRGLLATVQNPFLPAEVQRDRFSVRYSSAPSALSAPSAPSSYPCN
jgi:hypothetical protein